MPFARSVLLCFLLSATAAFAQSEETVRRDIAAALSTPLPITVIGPLMAPDIRVTSDGDSFRVELDNPLVMGIVPIGPVSFRVTPKEDGALYHVTDFRLPPSVDVFNTVTLAIGSTDFDGLWSLQSRSYRTLDFRLNDISVRPRNVAGAEIGAGSLGLKVAKQETGGATESWVALSATELVVKGFTDGDDATLKRLEAELKAKGKEPVDLYAVITRFAVLSMMQRDSSQLLQFAESLRVKSYDTVSLGFTMEGLAVTGSAPARHLSVASLKGKAAIDDITPAEWGKLTFGVDAAGISDIGYGGAQRVDVANAHTGITGDRIPIGATLNAISGLQSLHRGDPVRILATDLLDGFVNVGSLALDVLANDMTVRSLANARVSSRVGSYSTHVGLDGFRDGAGRISVALAADEMDLSGIGPKSSPLDAVDRRLFQTLNPTTVRYDLHVSDLGETLLRKLMTGIAISSTEDLAGLSVPALAFVMAIKPVMETKDARFSSKEVDLRTTSKVRVYPAWAIGALPYEGTQRISLSGYDKLLAMLNDLERMQGSVTLTEEDMTGPASSDDRGAGAFNHDSYDIAENTGNLNTASIAFIRGLMGTIKALSADEGGRMVWDIDFPEARTPLFRVNDVTLRYPDIAAYLPLIGMSFGGL